MSLISQSVSLNGTQDVNQQTLPKEVKRTHSLSYKRHRACMHVETDYVIGDRGKDFLRKCERLKDCDIPQDSTNNTFIFDKLVKAANQTHPSGKIALWHNILRLQIAFLVSYPSRKEEKILTASEIHTSGLPIIVSDFVKKNNDTLGAHNVEIMPFNQNEDHVKIYLGNPSKGNKPRSQNSSSNSTTALATILRMKISIRFVNCNQKHNSLFQKEVRDRFYTDLCSTTTAPMIKILLERCMRLFLNTYIIKKFQTSLFKVETIEMQETVPQIEQLVEAMTSITLENKQSERLQKAFTLLSDIVKAKEGAIPLFHNPDSTRSHAEHQSTRWVYQTALMRSDWKMRKKELNDHIVALPGAKKSHHNTPHVLISENVRFPFRTARKATTTTQSEDETMEEVVSQIPSQSSSQDASNEVQATTIDRVVDAEESVSSASFHSTQSTTVNTSMEEKSSFRMNTNICRSSASEGMTEVFSSSTNTTTDAIITTNKATKSQQNKRCANTETSSNKTQHKTYSNLSANLTLKQENSAKEIVTNSSKATDAKMGQKQNIASTGTSAVASSSKPSEEIKTGKKDVVETGTCIENAIEVYDIPMIDLTVKGPSKESFESDSEDGFEVVKVNIKKTPKFAGKRLAQIKKEVKKER